MPADLIPTQVNHKKMESETPGKHIIARITMLALPRGSVLSSCGYPLHCFPERDNRRESVLQLCRGPEIAPTPTCGQRQSPLYDDRAVSSMMSTTCAGAQFGI
jgi:hypothetical protein